MKNKLIFKKIGITLFVIMLFVVVYFSFFRKGFYEYTHADFDLLRIPLIKPYEIYSADIKDAENWSSSVFGDKTGIKFQGFMPGTPGVDSIGIANQLIILHSRHEIINSNMSPAWFIFDSETKHGDYFLTQEDFKNHLKNSYNISNVNFYDPALIFQDFKKNFSLPPEWRPYIAAENTKWWK